MIKVYKNIKGDYVMKKILYLRNKGKVEFVTDRIEELGEDASKCRKLAIPSTGVSLGQLTFKF